MIYRNGIYYDRMIRNGIVYDRMMRNGIQHGQPDQPQDFKWQARINLSVNGGTGDTLDGFNTLRPTTPIPTGTAFTDIVDTNGNALPGVTVTVTGSNVIAEASTGPIEPDANLYHQRWRNNGSYHIDISGLDATKRYQVQILSQEQGATAGQIISTYTYVNGTSTLMGTISRDATMPVPAGYDFSDQNWVRFDEIEAISGAFRIRIQRNGSLARAVTIAVLLTEYDIVMNGTQTLNTAGSTPSPLPYISYEPTGGAATKPAIIWLHGSGERGNGTSQLPNAMKFGPNRQAAMGTFAPDAFAFSPQITTAGYWSANVDALDSFVDYLLTTYPIDPTRVYIVAFSDGCVGLGCLITKTQGAKIAAALSIGYDPAYTEGQPREDIDYNEVAKLPCWTFGATNDPVTAISDTITGVNVINGISPGICKLTVFKDYNHENAPKVINGTGMGTMIDPEYDPFDQNVYDWLLQHSI